MVDGYDWIAKKFHDLSIDDLYEIIRLRIEVFVVEQDCPYQDCDGKDKAAIHIFLKEEGQVIAYSRIFPKGAYFDEAAIGRIVVKKAYRNRGIAGLMIKHAIECIKEHFGDTRIRISAQAHLEKFYHSLGFRKASGIYLEDNIPHIKMLYGGDHDQSDKVQR